MNFNFCMTQGTLLLMNMLHNRIGFVTVTPYHAVVMETHVIMQTHRLIF